VSAVWRLDCAAVLFAVFVTDRNVGMAMASRIPTIRSVALNDTDTPAIVCPVQVTVHAPTATPGAPVWLSGQIACCTGLAARAGDPVPAVTTEASATEDTARAISPFREKRFLM
jgi:hypothetical protein